MLSRDEQLVAQLIRRCPPLGTTVLVKLVYLIDIEALKFLGRPLSGFKYRWHHYGPYDGRITGTATRLCHRHVCKRQTVSYANGDWGYQYSAETNVPVSFDDAEAAIIDKIVRDYGSLSAKEIKKVAYETQPMKAAIEHQAFGKQLDMALVAGLERTPGLELERVWESHRQAERGELVSLSDVLAKASG